MRLALVILALLAAGAFVVTRVFNAREADASTSLTTRSNQTYLPYVANGSVGSQPNSTPTLTRTPTRTPTRLSATATPTQVLSPTMIPTPATDPNCVVTSVQSLLGVPPTSMNPPPQDFVAPLHYVIALNPTPVAPTASPSADTVSQLYVDNVCLSCNPPAGSGAPAVNLYKGQASLSPKGDWVLFVGEMASHPAFPGSAADVSYEVHNGWWGDLWAVTPDGSRWYNLTNLVVPSNGSVAGTLAAHLSPDQTQLIWSTMTPNNPAGSLGTVGGWNLMLADFVVQNGVPSLQNVRDISPQDGIWYEPHDWSPDGTKVVISSDLNLPYAYGGDNFLVDLATNSWTNITNQPLYWEEHTYYSASGKKILVEEQFPNPSLLPENATLPYDQWRPLLRAEAWVMNPDGSQAMQLTGLGVPAPPGVPDPEYNPTTPSTVFGMQWNSTGTQAIVPQNVLDGTTGTATDPAAWLLTFAGPCG